MEVENARIKSTMLGVEDHGIFTAFLMLEYDGRGQGFGGYALDTNGTGTAWGMEFVMRLLATLEVKSWEKLPGTYCRAEHDHDSVKRIGHITKDRWFDPKVDLEHLKS